MKKKAIFATTVLAVCGLLTACDTAVENDQDNFAHAEAGITTMPMAEPSIAGSASSADLPSIAKMQSDLLGGGVSMGCVSPGSCRTWRFDSLNEFKRFEIVDEFHTDAVANFYIDASLGAGASPTVTANIHLHYSREEDGTWGRPIVRGEASPIP